MTGWAIVQLHHTLYKNTLPELSWTPDHEAAPPQPADLKGSRSEMFLVVEMASLLSSPLNRKLASPICPSVLLLLFDWSGWFVSQLRYSLYLAEVYHKNKQTKKKWKSIYVSSQVLALHSQAANFILLFVAQHWLQGICLVNLSCTLLISKPHYCNSVNPQLVRVKHTLEKRNEACLRLSF